MKYKLSECDIEAIEKAINYKGPTEAVVKIEKDKIIVVMVERKRIL